MSENKQSRCVLRIMSFNVWGNCPPGTTISNRDDNEAALVLRYLPDAVGFQEFSPKIRAEEKSLASMIAHEYTEVPVIPTNERKNNYTPIFYRPSKLTLIDFGWKYYAGLNDAGSKTATWGCFEIKDSSTRFIFINTHFYWTGDDKGKTARISNAGELLSLMVEVREKYPYPVFFGGDFNCATDSIPLDILRRFGLCDVRYAAPETSPWRSHHKYPEYDFEQGIFCRGTHPTGEFRKSIDHIFSFGDVRALRFVTVVDSEALDSSDHCPIYADFEI